MTNKINPQQFGKVAVLMGGEYSERDISLMSGNAVLTALKQYGINAHGVDVGADICEVLLKEKFDRAFIAMHGTFGEDGTIQGMLEFLKIPYTGSDVLASALAMDKEKSKLIWQALGLPTPAFMMVDEHSKFEDVAEKLSLPLCVKPTSEGSSFGVTKVTDKSQFLKAIKDAKQFHAKVMAEPWIEGDEVTVGILGDEPLPVIRITTDEIFYDYKAKYFSEKTTYHIPSGLSEEKEQALQKLSLQAYDSLDCRHWARVDAIQDKHGDYWLLEVNTIPGLTSHSLVPKAAASIGVDFAELVIRILRFTV